jgi:alkylation response protein AidB-like acyl-CoA dehydrogenase
LPAFDKETLPTVRGLRILSQGGGAEKRLLAVELTMHQIRRMDVRLSEEQRLLQESAREFLEGECPMSRVRQAMDDPVAASAGLWKKMAELGWTGLAVPEQWGGAGLGWLDVAIVMEQMGRVLCPAPFFGSAVLATEAVLLAGAAEQHAAWLPALASGAERATLAFLEPAASWRVEDVALAARPSGSGSSSGWSLRGIKRFVPDALEADWLLVPARTEDGLALFRVEAEAPGVSIRRLAHTDETRSMAEVGLDDVPVDDTARLAGALAAEGALERCLDAGRAALAAEMVGAAERVLELSVAYARTREQFGRPIGSFQAIQHRCADMLVHVESARSAATYAAWAVGEQVPEAPTAALLAKAHCAQAFTAVAGDGIQIHGGQGFTWEQDLHLYYKRALADEQLLGDPFWCRDRAAQLVLDGSAPAP